MTMKVLDEESVYRSADLALVATISLFYPIETIERQNGRKAYFLFKRNEKLDELIERYWRGELQVEPTRYFNALRVIKARLYGEE